MSMGRVQDTQGDLFITPSDLPTGEGHLFYEKLNQLLSKHQIDKQVESLCCPFYDDGSRGGRPSLPPGVYFRMNLIGYFEGIASYRGITRRAWDRLERHVRAAAVHRLVCIGQQNTQHVQRDRPNLDKTPSA